MIVCLGGGIGADWLVVNTADDVWHHALRPEIDTNLYWLLPVPGPLARSTFGSWFSFRRILDFSPTPDISESQPG